MDTLLYNLTTQFTEYNNTSLDKYKLDLSSRLKNISMSICNDSVSEDSQQLDFVCSSGGLKAMYISKLPLFMFGKGRMKFIRASGASSGAFCASCALCEIDVSKVLEIYNREKKRIKQYGITLKPGELIRIFCHEILPNNVHLICNSRLFIAVHVLTSIGFERQIFSEFDSKEDLINCILASCTIPFVTFPFASFTFRGKVCVDGICPYLFDDEARDVLCIDLWKIEYPKEYATSVSDPDIDSFASSGLKHFQDWWSSNSQSVVFGLYRTPNNHLNKLHWYSRILEYLPIIIILFAIYKKSNTIKKMILSSNR